MPKDNDKSKRINSFQFLLLAVVLLGCIYGVFSAWQTDQVPRVVTSPPQSTFSERYNNPSAVNDEKKQTEWVPQSQTGSQNGKSVVTSRDDNKHIDKDVNTGDTNNRTSNPNDPKSDSNKSTKSSARQEVGNQLPGDDTTLKKQAEGVPTWMVALVIGSLATSLISLGFVVILLRTQPKITEQPSVFDEVMKEMDVQLSSTLQSLSNHVESRLSETTKPLRSLLNSLTGEVNDLNSRVQMVQSQISKINFDVANQSRQLGNNEPKESPKHITNVSSSSDSNVSSSSDSIVGVVESATQLSTSEQEVLNRIVSEVNRHDVVYGSVRSGTRDWDYFSEALKSMIRSELQKLDVDVIEPAIGETIDLTRMDFDSAPLGHRNKVKEVVMLGFVVRSTGAIAKAKVIVE